MTHSDQHPGPGTGRVVLRPVETSDLAATRRWRGQESLWSQTLGFRFPITERMEAEWLASLDVGASPAAVTFAIDIADEPELVGICMLRSIDWISRRADLGVFIGAGARRGIGIGDGALRLLLDYAASALGLRKICLQVRVDNLPAISLYARNGFEQEGLLREHFYCRGIRHDILVMARFLE